MREALAAALILIPIVAFSAESAPPAPLPSGPAPPPSGPAIEQRPVEKVTLPAAVQRALQNNPTVAVAIAEVDRANALVTQARAGWLPIVTGNGSYTRLDHDRVLSGATAGTGGAGGSSGTRIIAAENQLAGNLQLTVPIIAATGWTATNRAKSGVRIAEASAVDVRRQVAQATARAYITVVAEHRLVEASETARDTAKQHYDYSHKRLEGGIGRAIDEVRAQQDLATVEVQLQANLVGLARAREALSVLIAADVPVDAADEVDLGPPPSIGDAMAGARQRTDVKVLDMRLGAAKHARSDVWAYYAPYLAAVGTPFLQHPATLTQPEFGWQAQLVLTLPLFDGGMRRGITRERDAVVKEAQENLEAGLRQAQSEVRLDFEAMVRADQALQSAREAGRLARRAMELANIAYKAGATTNLEVIDAARQARDADTATAQAEDVARQARLDLLVASGRFP